MGVAVAAVVGVAVVAGAAVVAADLAGGGVIASAISSRISSVNTTDSNNCS